MARVGGMVVASDHAQGPTGLPDSRSRRRANERDHRVPLPLSPALKTRPRDGFQLLPHRLRHAVAPDGAEHFAEDGLAAGEEVEAVDKGLAVVREEALDRAGGEVR